MPIPGRGCGPQFPQWPKIDLEEKPVAIARNVLLHRNLEVTLATALQNEAVYEELAVRSDDFKEGMRSFAERRPPEYTGW